MVNLEYDFIQEAIKNNKLESARFKVLIKSLKNGTVIDVYTFSEADLEKEITQLENRGCNAEELQEILSELRQHNENCGSR